MYTIESLFVLALHLPVNTVSYGLETISKIYSNPSAQGERISIETYSSVLLTVGIMGYSTAELQHLSATRGDIQSESYTLYDLQTSLSLKKKLSKASNMPLKVSLQKVYHITGVLCVFVLCGLENAG
ncbi:hypothetical protein HK102_005994 [Quaeritorhiza haematococci]|nr:hypothetical protein HK102_005994 [Quaeritorhiza haematococci]